MNTDFTETYLRERIALYLEPERIPKKIKIITDTSNFFSMEYNDVLILKNRAFLLRNCEKEGRFTIDEQPKFWVRRALDLSDGSMKIIKMVFHEKYEARVGDIVFECFRSPGKESKILELTRNHKNFMQGYSEEDSAGNLIRVIEFISGKTLGDDIAAIQKEHEDYFFNDFPDFFSRFIELVKAIRLLHGSGVKHGDIRRDHIIRDSKTDTYRWIDFDYNFFHRENMFGFDLFGLGNVLVYLTAGDEITTHGIYEKFSHLKNHLNDDDLNIIFSNRIVNLKKIHSHIPEKLNRILMHFSKNSEVFYDDTDQFIADLEEVKSDL